MLFCLVVQSANARITDVVEMWKLDGNFEPARPTLYPLDASSLTAGTDYSFATDSDGYGYLQTQPFTPASKRLTVTNNVGPNGPPLTPPFFWHRWQGMRPGELCSPAGTRSVPPGLLVLEFGIG